MEKKTTRRIIGVLVVIALVIILLPLMFNSTETQSPIQTSEAKAPPFPSNEIETAQAAGNSQLIPPSQSGALISRIVAPSKQQVAPATPANAPVVTAETVANTTSQALSQPAAVVETNTVNSSANAANLENMAMQNPNVDTLKSTDMMSIRPVNELTANTNPAPAENVIVIDSEGDGVTTTISKNAAQADLNRAEPAAAAATVKTITSTTTTAVEPAPVKTATVKPANLKKGAWIVQLGSFKNKINAERLTNALRARGYKAFTQETRGNGQIRVCVGPEFKQFAAATLANKLAQEINMRGIVMAYQPLEL
jgi:cell division septation protein DedD